MLLEASFWLQMDSGQNFTGFDSSECKKLCGMTQLGHMVEAAQGKISCWAHLEDMKHCRGIPWVHNPFRSQFLASNSGQWTDLHRI
jgi:hypothetical protein